jgi:hypothetical protein
MPGFGSRPRRQSGSPLQIHGRQALALFKILISHNFVMGHGWSGPSFIVLQETQHATTADSLVRHALNIVKYKQTCIMKTDPCVGFPPIRFNPVQAFGGRHVP